MFWLAGLGGGFAAKDDDARGAFVVSSLDFFVELVFFVIQTREVVFDLKQVRLFCAQTAGDAPYLAHRTGGFAGFPAAAGYGHHNFVAEGDHFDEVSRTGLRAGSAAGTFFVVHSCQAVNDVQGVELAGAGAVAVAEAAEFAGLNVRQGIGGGAGEDSLILRQERFILGVCTAVNDWAFRRTGVADLQVQDGSDFVGGFGAAGVTFSNKLWIFDDGLCVFETARESAAAAIEMRKHGVQLLKLGVDVHLEFFACD